MSLHEQLKDIIRRAVVIGHASAWLGLEEGGGSRAMGIAKLTREATATAYATVLREIRASSAAAAAISNLSSDIALEEEFVGAMCDGFAATLVDAPDDG